LPPENDPQSPESTLSNVAFVHNAEGFKDGCVGTISAIYSSKQHTPVVYDYYQEDGRRLNVTSALTQQYAGLLNMLSSQQMIRFRSFL